MAKVRTFSRYYPKGHPKEGQPTFFVEKIWNGLNYLQLPVPKNKDMPHDFMWSILPLSNYGTKFHTIRAGNHFKPGDKFSPRVWNGKPYASKQIIIAPDIEVIKDWKFEMQPAKFLDECRFLINEELISQENYDKACMNDGLSRADFANWFCGAELMSTKRKPFKGQIICWSKDINY